MPRSGDEAQRWADYVGEYRVLNWGVISPMQPAGRFLIEGGDPYVETSETGTAVRHRLTEIERGLFIADDGETLDFRGVMPTWRNIELVRATGGPTVWQWAVLAFVGFLAGASLVTAAVSALQRRRRRTVPASIANRQVVDNGAVSRRPLPPSRRS